MRLSNGFLGTIFGVSLLAWLTLSSMYFYWGDVHSGLNGIGSSIGEALIINTFGLFMTYFISKMFVYCFYIFKSSGKDTEKLAKDESSLFTSYVLILLSCIYGFSSIVAFNEMSNHKHYFDYRDFVSVKMAYAKEYSNNLNYNRNMVTAKMIPGSFIGSKLSVFNAVDRNFIERNISFYLPVNDLVTIDNFKVVDKNDIFESGLNIAMTNFIANASSLDNMIKRHVLLKSKFMSPYSDADFDTFDLFKLN